MTPSTEHGAVGGRAGQVHGVDVVVLVQPGADLLGVAGQQVHHGAGHVAGGQHLAEVAGVVARTVLPLEFFAPQNIGRILEAAPALRQ